MPAIFDRVDELSRLRAQLRKRRSFLLHGPAGVGKTLLMKEATRELPAVLYSEASASSQAVFRNLAAALIAANDGHARSVLGRVPADAIRAKSAAAIKGIVIESLRQGEYWAVLDQLGFTSQSFATAVREISGWADTPVIAIARSAHMEDVGFLLHLYPGRSERFEIRDFTPEVASRFVHIAAADAQLTAENVSEFLERAVELSNGNPGAMLAMIELAKQSKYRSAGFIKVTPLYVDFRLKRNAANHA